MRSFAGVGDRFLKTMSTEDGPHIRGTIMPASDQEGSPFEFSAPRLVLRTRAESEARPGLVLLSRPGGPRYIIGDHYAVEPDYRSWRLFLAERQYSWQRPTKGTDALSGLPKNSGKTTPVMIWASVEHDRRMFTDPGLRVKTERVTLVTPTAVKAGDFLDDQLVTRVTEDLGLYIAEYA